MIRRNTKHSILLLALLAALSWLGARDQRAPPAKPFDDLDTRLNYALWDFNAKLLNDKGEVNLHIEAPILRNNADSQVGTMEYPRVRIQQQDHEWYITADSAIITADREYVSLIGHVDMLRESRSTDDRLEISTRDIMLNVTPQTATTDAVVSISQNKDHLQADGMKLNMKTNSYELLDEVHAIYATP